MTDDWTPVPPDVAAEQCTLGAMILSPAAAAEASEIVCRDDFTVDAHRTVFEHITAMRERGTPVDTVTLVSELTAARAFVGAFDPLYVNRLTAEVPTASNVGTYAKRVARIGGLRRLDRDAGIRVRQLVRQPDADPDEILATLHATIEVETRLAQHASGDRPGKSWRPADLRAILNGDKSTVEPTVGLSRTDGIRLLYPGKEHTVLGEMECGKSWFSTASCAAELLAGHHVLYIHFEECDATDTVERIRDLGVPVGMILDRFRFVGPLEPVRPDYLAELLDPAPSLVVLDGVNEAMALHGQGIREEDGAAAFRRVLVKPCTSVGAAVLSCDHVVKDREARGRSPLGSIHKGNGINGTLIMLENAEPFGRGQRGRSSVFITKDRPGQLRRQGRATKLAGKTFMGSLVVDDTRMQVHCLDLTFWAPAPDDDAQADDPIAVQDKQVLDAVHAVIATGHPPNVTNIRAKAGMQAAKAAESLARLVLEGVLDQADAPRNSKLFTPTTGSDLEKADS